MCLEKHTSGFEKHKWPQKWSNHIRFPAHIMVREGWLSRDGVPIFEPHGFPTRSCRNEWPAKRLPPEAETAARIVLADFDAVLFRTPER